jgi:hypothetical protein
MVHIDIIAVIAVAIVAVVIVIGFMISITV